MNSIRPVLWLYLFLAILARPLIAAEYAGANTTTLLVRQ